MSKKFAFLMAAVTVIGAAPALAQNAVCVEPVAMAVTVNGKTASSDQMRAAMTQARDFVAKSDTYQQCVADDLEAKKQAAAKAGTPFDDQLEQVAKAKVAANQQAKDKLVADTNAQIVLYKQQTASK
ncbi:MAG: hypothetical protein JO256_02710 [Alphaproteobacteria bacterium]|nr:hypothetical protein [Alphaproteobacteria bacterium]